MRPFHCSVDTDLLTYKYRTFIAQKYNLEPFDIQPDDVVQTNLGCLLMVTLEGERFAAAFVPANVQLNPILDLKLHKEAMARTKASLNPRKET